MTITRRGEILGEWLWVVAAIVVALAWLARTQPLISGGTGNDGGSYLEVASQLQRGLVPVAARPFVNRIGTPWLAAGVAGATGLPLARAFFLINLSAGVGASLLLAVWLRGWIADAGIRIIVLIFALVMPYSPTRFTFYYPILTDPVACMFLIAGLIVLDGMRRHDDAARRILLTLLVALGCAVREVVLVVALSALCVRPVPTRAAGWAGRSLPTLAGLLVIALVGRWVVVAPSSYSVVTTVMYFIKWKTVAMIALSGLFVFGPAVALLADDWRTRARRVIEYPHLFTYVAIFLLFGWLGGSDTERIFAFAAPVVLMWEGVVLARVREASVIRAAVIVIAQVLAYRILVPLGGATELSRYENFFAFLMSRDSIVAFLATYMLAMFVVFAATRPRLARAEPH